MHSREEHMKAIELYIKYDRCATDAVGQLGFPERESVGAGHPAVDNSGFCGPPIRGRIGARGDTKSAQQHLL